ncbi:Ig-like domain-containing domain [Paenibacillus pini]|uniref:SLH domain-containing protein n=1 Tax=Paenibacillus pini JCM 16418 TaxID=1236976 RepID=W7YI08_9BACL|nr:Ig-like domain-containing protein [Paenibacillus pini]GAF10530.1 hypothetical protein JCM16418_4740 [Paenibacillus pini JCM 16418]
MSNMSYLSNGNSKENSNETIQGGDKKVMKKILSVALSTAMAFSMFASVAFGDAATATTPEQKFDALKAKGVFSGFPDGLAHLEKDMTRAEFAKVITKLLGLKEVTGTLSYKDKNYNAKNWAVPYIEAVSAAGIMQGKDTAKKIFDFNGKVTVEEMATVLQRALKLEIPANPTNNASAWAKGYVQAAIDKGYISKDANFKANATRSVLVETAYAIDQARSIPTVASYKIVDSSNVEFTLSNGEVVKVKLDKALEANKETSVTFKDAAGHEITSKITWVVTSASKVQGAAASNLKEVVVTFDGTVDVATAENEDNYSIKGDKTVLSATASADKKSVTLLLDDKDSAVLVNQKETEVTVRNVKNEDKSKTIEQTVKFTPVDVQIPEVKEVVGLGTKAFKVKFSEPVKKAGVFASNNFKVDGKVIAANVEYKYPNIAIVNTALPVGDHTLTVSNVEDFSGLKVAPVETSFKIAEDTTAPEVVSVKTSDLRKVTVEFNETVKSVSKAYHNTAVNKATDIVISDNKVTLYFANPLNLNENTIYLEGVTDYSLNSANREAKVNPTLDTERPTVVKAKLSQQDNATKNHQITVEFSESVDPASATDRANYVLKDKNGKAAVVNGLNSNGKPVLTPSYNPKNNTVTIDLAGKLANGTYTLEVSGVKDTAYVANTMLPFSTTLDSSVAVDGTISRVWKVDSNNSNETYIYIQFNKTLSVEGVGDATQKAKYKVNGKALGSSDSVDLITPDTVRLTVSPKVNATSVQVNLVADKDGNFFVDSDGNYVISKNVGSDFIQVKADKDIVANSTEEIKVVFAGKLSYVDYRDFVAVQGDDSYYASKASLSEDGTTVTLTFADNNKLPADFKGNLTTIGNVQTQDAFGTRIASIDQVVVDKIAPEAKDLGSKSFGIKAVANASTYDITIQTTEALQLDISKVQPNFDKELFTVKINDKKVTSINTIEYKNDGKIVLNVTPAVTPENTDVVSVVFDGTANEAAKAVVDTSTSKNALKGFTLAEQLRFVEVK